MTAPRICKLTFGRNASSIGIGQSRPLLSWRFEQDDQTLRGWKQHAYEITLKRGEDVTIYHEVSDHSIEIPWPKAAEPLTSREVVLVSVRAEGEGGFGWTESSSEYVEAALLDVHDWSASCIAPDIVPPPNAPKRPFYTRQTITLGSLAGRGRIYATALGVYEIRINGKRIGDHILAPGWQSYNHRLHYQTYEIEPGVLVTGDNVLEAVVGEGWYSGRLTWAEQRRNIWGAETGVQIQFEMDGQVIAVTDSEWKWSYGKLLESGLYDGEVFDTGLVNTDWRPTKVISLPKSTTLIAPEAPPIRETEVITPKALLSTPSHKKIIDFGQNLVGWVTILNLPAAQSANDCVILRFAEVLDKGELGVRPLRSAKATDKIYLGDKPLAKWSPSFTTHGFRFCEVTGPAELIDEYSNNFVAVVIHSAMDRIGDFFCSHELINKLHRNVVWGLRGNFVGLPTDCPQRDERLGWTGDLQAFAPTAAFLYDTSGFLANWLHDLSEEQLKDSDGVVPLVVPDTLSAFGGGPLAQAVWGDVCVITPRDLYQAYGFTSALQEMWSSMTVWLDKGIKRGENGLWINPRDGFQLSDWLDPRAPPDDPGAGLTDQFLVADAYLVAITEIASDVAKILGKASEHEKYAMQHSNLRKVFQQEYLAPSGRLSSDTQTAYCLAFQFRLLDDQHISGAAERLIRLARKGSFRIATGFAGTPGILGALVEAGHLQVAYRMLQEKGCPSWLYPVIMDATTVWERWDSLLPDGSINPGEMTSFNHYALGAVASFLHTTVAGLQPVDPGYKRFLIQPRPGGTVTQAAAHTITPYGKAAVSWSISKDQLTVDFEIPPNTEAIVRLGGKEDLVGSGRYNRVVAYAAEGEWPPAPYHTQFAAPRTLESLAL